MSREWKVLMKKSAGVIEKCLRRIFIYANNEPKSALVRDPGDCRDHSYFTAIASISRRTSFGSLATSTQERAGQSFAKYFA